MKYIKHREYVLINEAILYYLDTFKEVNQELSKRPGIIGKIATIVLNTEHSNIKSDMSFVDVGTEGYLNYSSSVVVKSKLDGADILNDFKNNINDFFKSPIKIGKFINTITMHKFSASEVEQYVHSFIDATKNNLEKFKLVSGNDIIKYYNEDSYFDITRGTLSNSCMRHEECGDYLDILVDNSDKCKLLILQDNMSGRIMGRALLWNVEGSDEFDVLMDRIYYTDISEVSKFRKYAVDNGYGYKTHDSHSSHRFITINEVDGYYQLWVNLSPPTNPIGQYNYEKFPYLDTFSRYDYTKNILYNDANVYIDNSIVLMDEFGGFIDENSDPSSDKK